MYRPITQCRACGNASLRGVFDLGVQPLANDFCTPLQERSGFAPLKVLHCDECQLSQLSVVVRSDILYANYPYVTSTSRMMKDHFDHLLTLLKQRPHKSVLEIGSNDGAFLDHCRKNGIETVTGIDPALNLAGEANERGIRTIVGTFNHATATEAGQVDLVVARHVFCHVDNWRTFIEDLSLVTHENSTVFIEVPYLMDMLTRIEFDTIYHEHTSYLSITAIMRLLKDTPWALESVERFTIHGGAVGLFLRRKSDTAVSNTIHTMLVDEVRIPSLWARFHTEAFAQAALLAETVHDLNYDGHVVCGFGASAKSTVLINVCKFTPLDIRFICDCTPTKIGRLSPGSNIPVVPENRIMESEYAVLFAWNFWRNIQESQSKFMKKGGRFIFPVPNIPAA